MPSAIVAKGCSTSFPDENESANADAPAACTPTIRVRDTLPVIARGRGDHAIRAAARIHVHERVERTADLERAGLLKVFELEIDLAPGETRERVRLLGGRAADVRADGLGRCRDRGR